MTFSVMYTLFLSLPITRFPFPFPIVILTAFLLHFHILYIMYPALTTYTYYVTSNNQCHLFICSIFSFRLAQLVCLSRQRPHLVVWGTDRHCWWHSPVLRGMVHAWGTVTSPMRSFLASFQLALHVSSTLVWCTCEPPLLSWNFHTRTLA